MRFRTKLQLYIIPILVFTVLIVTSTVIYASSISIKAFQEDIMRYRLKVAYEYSGSEFETLERVKLESVDLYVKDAKNRVYEFIRGTEIPGGSFLIIDSNNTMVMHSKGLKFELPENASSYLKENVASQEIIEYNSTEGEFVVVYDYFEPWDWYVMAVADTSIIFSDVEKAIRVSLITSLFALIISIYSLRIISKTISKPVEELTNGTVSMQKGDYDVRIPEAHEGEFGELATAFNKMAEEIEDNFIQIRAKSESLSLLASFAAGMSHDLKTPIGNTTTIVTYMESELEALSKAYGEDRLTKEILENYIKEAHDAVGIVSKNITHASELVTGYKTVSVDQLNRERRWIDLKVYIDEIIYTLKPRFKGTQYSVNNLADENLSTWTYPGAISQIVTNLIVNSLVHGFENREEGTISIDAYKDNDNIVITYTDDGVGISEENLKNIYDAFFTTKHDQGGSGLGMHIIFNLVKSLLHGTLECESELGKGVKFTIIFPDESLDS